jgi:acetyl esterase/lipase
MPRGHRHGPRRLGRTIGVIVAVLAVVALLPGAVRLIDFGVRLDEGKQAEPTLSEFYSVPSPPPTGAPGDLLRSERVVGAPSGAQAWRILYHSSDEHGADAIVSGTVIAPTDASKGSRTVVSWGHPTTGTAPRCAPSIGIAPFFFIEGLTRLLAAGYVVVATDYAGMGAAGPPSFLLGTTESANVLDIVRAAQHIPRARASQNVILWGHSQGGHAALFAAQRAADYAPELKVLGVAVAAPATDLAALLAADIVDVSGVTIGAYAFTAYAVAYAENLPPDPLTTILTPAGVAAAPRMSELCLLGQNSKIHAIAKPLLGQFLAHEPANTSPWKEMLASNKPSSAALPIPLFVAQGQSDTLVRPEITAAFVAAHREAGTAVTSFVYPHTGHGAVALTALPDLLDWMKNLRH